MTNPPATHVGHPGSARPGASNQFGATPIFLLPSARALQREAVHADQPPGLAKVVWLRSGARAAEHRTWWAIGSSFVAILFVVGATVASVVALQTVRDMLSGVYPPAPWW